jgi:hypothetical protein
MRLLPRNWVNSPGNASSLPSLAGRLSTTLLTTVPPLCYNEQMITNRSCMPVHHGSLGQRSESRQNRQPISAITQQQSAATKRHMRAKWEVIPSSHIAPRETNASAGTTSAIIPARHEPNYVTFSVISIIFRAPCPALPLTPDPSLQKMPKKSPLHRPQSCAFAQNSAPFVRRRAQQAPVLPAKRRIRPNKTVRISLLHCVFAPEQT